MSPLAGKNKCKRWKFQHGEGETSESVNSKLKRLVVWRSDYSTIVYISSKDKRHQWFVKMTPFESRFCADKNDG